jgi:hypothetical protein
MATSNGPAPVTSSGPGLASSSLYFLVLAAFVGLFLSGSELAIFKTDRTAFFVLAVIGAFMCTTGLKDLATTGFTNPLNIFGYVAGALNLLLLAAVVFRFALPLVPDAHSAVIALAAIMGSKLVVYLVRSLAR